MKLRKNQLKPLRYDLSGALLPQHGIEPAQITSLLPRLSVLRDQLLRDTADCEPFKFVHLPGRMLAEYMQYRQTGTLGRIFQRANRTQALTDRVVVLGNHGVCVGPRLIRDACCQPHWNELSRGERGSKPRMYFDTRALDNDALQALLHLMGTARAPVADREIERWGLVALAPSLGDGNVESPAALEPFVSALQSQAGTDPALAVELLTAVTPPDSNLKTALQSMGILHAFSLDSLVATPCTALSPIGLFPAAVLGVNVMELVQGAAWMTEYFAQAPDEENIVFQMVALHHLLATERGITVRNMQLWNAGLRSFAEWYSDLVSTVLNDSATGAAPISVSTAGSFTKHAPPSRSIARNQAIHNIVVDSPRFDPLSVASSHVPNIIQAGIEASDTEHRAAGHPTTKLTIPILDELHLGQLLQLMMLATVLEAQLRGREPLA